MSIRIQSNPPVVREAVRKDQEARQQKRTAEEAGRTRRLRRANEEVAGPKPDEPAVGEAATGKQPPTQEASPVSAGEAAQRVARWILEEPGFAVSIQARGLPPTVLNLLQ